MGVIRKTFLFTILISLLGTLFVGCGKKENNLYDDPVLVVESILDQILFEKETEMSQEILQASSGDTRLEMMKYLFDYYNSLEVFTEEETALLADRVLLKTSEHIEFSLELLQKDKENAAVKVTYKTIDPKQFYEQYTLNFETTLGVDKMSLEERNKAAFDAYVAALDTMVMGEESYSFDVMLQHKGDKWRVRNMDELMVTLMGVLIGNVPQDK